jgi:DNA-binding MarR family transcriptional regulator
MPGDPLPPHPPEARSLGFLLREVYAQLQDRVYEAVAAAGHPGLRATHSPVLRHLDPGGGRVADLARACGLAKQSVAYVVEDLVSLGYLRVQADPEDGRARRLTYTAKGRDLLASLARASEDAEASLATAIGPARLRSLRAALEATLEAAAKAPAATPGRPPRRR